MSHYPGEPPLMLAGIPFEPARDDLDELRAQLEELPAWAGREHLFDDALELAAAARQALAEWKALPLPYFSELRALVANMGAIAQHRERFTWAASAAQQRPEAVWQEGGDPLAKAMRQALTCWDSPTLKALPAPALRAAYALAVASRVLRDLTHREPPIEEEGSCLDDMATRLMLAWDDLERPRELREVGARAVEVAHRQRASTAGKGRWKAMNPIREYATSLLPAACYGADGKRLKKWPAAAPGAVYALRDDLKHCYPEGDLPTEETVAEWLTDWHRGQGFATWSAMPSTWSPGQPWPPEGGA